MMVNKIWIWLKTQFNQFTLGRGTNLINLLWSLWTNPMSQRCGVVMQGEWLANLVNFYYMWTFALIWNGGTFMNMLSSVGVGRAQTLRWRICYWVFQLSDINGGTFLWFHIAWTNPVFTTKASQSQRMGLPWFVAGSMDEIHGVHLLLTGGNAGGRVWNLAWVGSHGRGFGDFDLDMMLQQRGTSLKCVCNPTCPTCAKYHTLLQ